LDFATLFTELPVWQGVGTTGFGTNRKRGKALR